MIYFYKHFRPWMVLLLAVCFTCILTTGQAQSNAPPDNDSANTTLSISPTSDSTSTAVDDGNAGSPSGYDFITSICLKISLTGSAILLTLWGLRKFNPPPGKQEKEREAPVTRQWQTLDTGELIITHPIHLKPDRISYSAMGATITAIGSIQFMLFMGYPFDHHSLKRMLMPLSFLPLCLAYIMRDHQTRTYQIDENGIHIRSGLIKLSTETIAFHKIKEIKIRERLYEKKRGVGTIMIDTGSTDEGEVVYTELKSIEHYREIAMLLGGKCKIEVSK